MGWYVWNAVPVSSSLTGSTLLSARKARAKVRINISVSELHKSLAAADITLGTHSGVDKSETAKANIAFTKCAAYAFDSLNKPLLFDCFMMHARILLKGGGESHGVRNTNTPQFENSAKTIIHRQMAKDLVNEGL